jgi:putative endonuclease
MNAIQWFANRFFQRNAMPVHLVFGQKGEVAARKHLQKHGMKFLCANYKSSRGEIDLVFRENDCLVFVEVKTRSGEDWNRPASAVDKRKKRALTRCSLDYLRALKNPYVKIRFDIVEVLLQEGEVHEVRHLENAFNMSQPIRFGG